MQLQKISHTFENYIDIKLLLGFREKYTRVNLIHNFRQKFVEKT